MTRLPNFVTLVLAGFGLFTPRSEAALTTTAFAQSTCPADSDHKRYVAHAFLADQDYADLRAEAGLVGVDPTQLRALVSTTDASACQQLNVLVGPGGVVGPSSLSPWTFYTAGGRYILVSAHAPPIDPSVAVLSHDLVIVLDSSFRVVADFML